MLDIKFIRQNPEIVQKAAEQKGIDIKIEHLLAVDRDRRELQQKVEALRAQGHEIAESLKGTLKDETVINQGREIRKQTQELDSQLSILDSEYNALMLLVPNIPSLDSPIGPDSDSNKEIFKWGELPKFSFSVKNHIELGKSLDIIDLEQGAKVSGFRGYYLKNEGAILHWAVLQYALNKMISKGFIPMMPPTLVHDFVLVGSGHFPFGKESIYQIANPGKLETGEEIQNPVYLTGTSEPSLLAYYAEKTLSDKDLPIKVCALTQCYRSEVGDYGKDVKGLYRVHEFTKVEQVVICKNDLRESEDFFNKMQAISEEILQELGLPYHVLQTSTGDMGAGKYRMNDLEAWMPGRGKYGETHSNSSLTDWQARRLNLKYKTQDGQTNYCHTLNNTVLASPRILIAILENFQTTDGSVKIPEVLQKYTGFSEIKPK